MPNMQDLIRKLLSGEIQPPPIAQLIGFRVVSIENGQAMAEFEASERHANPMGTLHGGVLCDVADFLKPVWKEKRRAFGRVVKSGKTIGLVECDVLDEKDHLVAHATSTCMVLRGAEAERR